MITVVPGPEADYAVIDGAWLNDEPYFAFHRVCVSEAHKGKDWLQASSLILRHLQRKGCQKHSYRHPSGQSSMQKALAKMAILSAERSHYVPEAKPEIPGSPTRKF